MESATQTNEAALMECLSDGLTHHPAFDELPAWVDLVQMLAASPKLVIIAGAGASREAHVPDGNKVVETIMAGEYGELVGRMLEVNTDEKPRLSFFRVLSAYWSIVGENQFRRFLKQTMEPSDAWISETYELLAHIIHHHDDRVAAIISLNFDEFLDRAIALETQTADAQELILPTVSVSEFGALRDRLYDLQRAGQVPYRQYLKPHGTISRTGTLRRTESTVLKEDRAIACCRTLPETRGLVRH
jgi:hypothetical protein